MELKEIQDELLKIKLTEEITTVEFIKRVFTRHSSVLDLSNHFLFEKSTSMLIKLLKSKFKSKKHIKSLVLQNCMINESFLLKILRLFVISSNRLKSFDISNNRLTIESPLTQLISVLFSKTPSYKSFSLKGNICTSPQAMSELFTQNIKLLNLNLYDTNLSAEALTVIASALRNNVPILNLNLGFNSAAFEDSEIVTIFSESVAENKFIEHLDLSGNESLGTAESLTQLCIGLKQNRSLIGLKLGGISLEDFGVKILAAQLLKEIPLAYLDIQNNKIQDNGFKNLLIEFPISLTSLDISYNVFKENTSIISLSTLLLENKSLRKLNLSHSFELAKIETAVIDLLCESLTKNDALSDLLCEGVKISDDPDLFCYKLNQAIALRKLSLTYKISAVNCFSNASSITSYGTNEKSQKFISNIPSNLSQFKDKSYSHTDKKEFVETPDQEPIVNTSRHYNISTSFD